MTTLSVPIPAHMEEFIDGQVKNGYASNKAEVVRKAITLLEGEEAIRSILNAEREIKEGKILRGDLRKLARKIR